MGNGKRLWLMLALAVGGSASAARVQAATRAEREPTRLGGAVLARRSLLLAQNEPPPDGVVVDPGVVYPTQPPPDLIPEYPPPSPGYGHVWIRGYWDWGGYEWAWNSGFWAPQQAGVVFNAPRFVFVNGEPVYYRGYWLDPYGRREYGYGWRGAPPAAWRARPSVAPTDWRAQHSEGWRRAPGAPTVWRGPTRREFVGGRPVAEPRRFEHGPAMGHPMAEPARPFQGGFHPGEPASRAPVGAAPHSMAPAAPHPAPAAHAAPAPRRR